jgi:hypothetical protein
VRPTTTVSTACVSRLGHRPFFAFFACHTTAAPDTVATCPSSRRTILLPSCCTCQVEQRCIYTGNHRAGCRCHPARTAASTQSTLSPSQRAQEKIPAGNRIPQAGTSAVGGPTPSVRCVRRGAAVMADHHRLAASCRLPSWAKTTAQHKHLPHASLWLLSCNQRRPRECLNGGVAECLEHVASTPSYCCIDSILRFAWRVSLSLVFIWVLCQPFFSRFTMHNNRTAK